MTQFERDQYDDFADELYEALNDRADMGHVRLAAVLRGLFGAPEPQPAEAPAPTPPPEPQPVAQAQPRVFAPGKYGG